MFAFAEAMVDDAERAATDFSSAIRFLRRLSLPDFAELTFSMPARQYPHLSSMLPRMASEKIQVQWTGVKGAELLKHSLAFMRILGTAFVRHTGRSLQDANVLDFGCGYGRFIRLFYYHTDSIAGIDAWAKSLETCTAAGIMAELALSEAVPTTLPLTGPFDLAFAFSVFSHLSERSARACLSAIRKTIKPDGLFVLTIRPIEFWAFRDRLNKSARAVDMESLHRSGFAFDPQRPEYGDTSMPMSFFEGHGWTVVGYDTIPDSYQVAVILRPI